MRFMEKDEASKTMGLFEGACESRKISKSSLKNWVVRAILSKSKYICVLIPHVNVANSIIISRHNMGVVLILNSSLSNYLMHKIVAGQCL